MVSAMRPLPLAGSEGNDDAHNAGDEHGEDTRDQQKAQEHILTLRTERPNEVARQQHVETRLSSCGSQDKSTKEEHDGGVGEGRHDMLRVHQFADVLTLEGHQRIVRNGQTHDGDDSERCSPRGNTLRQPRQGSEHKDRNDALLHDGEAVNAESVDRQVPNDGRDNHDNEELDDLLFVIMVGQNIRILFCHDSKFCFGLLLIVYNVIGNKIVHMRSTRACSHLASRIPSRAKLHFFLYPAKI